MCSVLVPVAFCVLHVHVVSLLDVSCDVGPEDDEETRPYVPIPALHLPHHITTVSLFRCHKLLVRER